jgi:cytochrome c peroxidase
MISRFFTVFFILYLFTGLACADVGNAKTEDSNLSKYTVLFKPLSVKRAEIKKDSLVELGEKLYRDNLLSSNKSQSCNTCHKLDNFGVDNLPTSKGAEGKNGARNSPTVYNSSLNFVQFWDGRAATLEEQAIGPIFNPVEMNMTSEEQLITRLKSVKEYTELFSKAFGKEKDLVTVKNVGAAIAAFERTLLTPSRFDKFLEGKHDIFTNSEIKGFKTFVNIGCASCHSGVGIGGGMYQKLGLVKPYKTNDLGRFTVTKNESDKYVFKVPSLRLVKNTFPYFHDGSVKTLEEAVKLMAKHQLGKELSDADVKSIVTFLQTL